MSMLEDFTIQELEKKYKMKKQRSENKAEFIERIEAQEKVDDAQDARKKSNTIKGIKIPQAVNVTQDGDVYTFCCKGAVESLNVSAPAREVEKIIQKLGA